MRIAIVTESFPPDVNGGPAAVAGFVEAHGVDVPRDTRGEVDRRTA
ncbi:hypothetical protein ACLQ24_20685 [Micromonospora sp. DT4]